MTDTVIALAVLAALGWIGWQLWLIGTLEDERAELLQRDREAKIREAVDSAAEELPEDDRARLAKILNDGLP